jgi:hypothetical protein
MNGPGNLVTKISRRYNNDPLSGDKVTRLSDKPVWNKFSSKPSYAKSKYADSNRFEGHSEVKHNLSEHSKRSQISTTNYDEMTGNQSESDHFDSVGGTLADGIKSMKMFPVLNSYQEVDPCNRSYLWKVYLESLGGKYVIIDKVDTDQDSTNEVYDKNVIRKIEISTLIDSDSELYATPLDLDNQMVISLDIARTRNPILPFKEKAEKMLTLFCKAHKITYKQGMNEVISLFLL